MDFDVKWIQYFNNISLWVIVIVFSFIIYVLFLNPYCICEFLGPLFWSAFWSFFFSHTFDFLLQMFIPWFYWLSNILFLWFVTPLSVGRFPFLAHKAYRLAYTTLELLATVWACGSSLIHSDIIAAEMNAHEINSCLLKLQTMRSAQPEIHEEN